MTKRSTETENDRSERGGGRGLTAGLDVGDRYSYYCVLDGDGHVVEEGRVATTRDGLRRQFGKCPAMRIALEVGTHSPWASRLLSGFGHEVLVANPRKLRMIYQSRSNHDPQLRITKEGDVYVRRMLVQAAQYQLGPFGPDGDLKRFGKRLAERGGKNAKKRAVVAVARKLAVLLHRLWRTGEVYEPFRQPVPSPSLAPAA